MNKKLISLNICFLSIISGYSQEKKNKFYNESSVEISKNKFLNTHNNNKNLAIYLENDSIKFNLLINRKKSGNLNGKSFNAFKKHLDELNGTQLDSTKNKVIIYLSATPNISPNINLKTTWNIFDNDYLKKLNRIDDLEILWIHSPMRKNLEYFHSDRINWVADKGDVLKNLFFEYETSYGNFIIVKPNGQYFYYLGEFGKQHVLRYTRKFLK
jgi:hypothetical protein|tara:strand:- start:58 stop:696 length:639 start_codon:yes stop_codon:yes gene_type:complete